jgi:hypothetical protein
LDYLALGERNRELSDRNLQLESELEVLRDELARLKHDSTYT